MSGSEERCHRQKRPCLVHGPDCLSFQGNGIILAELITRKLWDSRAVSGSKEDPHHKPTQTARPHCVKISSPLETQAIGSCNTTCLVLFIPRRQFPLVVLCVILHLPVWKEGGRGGGMKRGVWGEENLFNVSCLCPYLNPCLSSSLRNTF